ncbi:MAG: MATE family efflux transporter [Chitinispirillaceae bacterium]|nr:MATE family efflux transporter [Chitinispirillaceae bacterium]
MAKQFKAMLKQQLSGRGGAGELVGIAAPLVVSFACETVMMFTDRLFLSRLSGAHMAAAMGGGLMAFTFMTFFLGIHGYGTAMVAQQFGAGKKEHCPLVVSQALIIGLIGYPIILSGIPLGIRMFRLSGVDTVQLQQQQMYFSLLMTGTIITLTRSSIGCFFSGIGKTGVIMVAAGASMTINVGLNYLLIFGKIGFPEMGIRGAAIGTIIANFTGLCILLIVYLRYSSNDEYRIPKSFRFNRQLMAELLRYGYPAGLEMLLNLIAFTTLVTTFHSCGEAVATAITIAFNWDMVSFVPMIGLSIGVTSLAGRYTGASDRRSVYRSAYTGIKLAAIYSGFLLIPFLFFTGPLVELFLHGTVSGNDEVSVMAVFMVKMISVYLFCDAVLQVFGGALRGVGDTFWVMTVSVTMHWSFALLTIIALKVAHLDPRVTWCLVIGAFFFFGPIFFVRFRSGRWGEKTDLLPVNHGMSQVE